MTEALPRYRGTKEVFAKPMTRLAYNIHRGWELPEDENGDDEGFLVEYVDGGQGNHPDHAGYISWSPKDVFERAYRACETHIDRMRIEYDELAERLAALTAFIGTDPFDALPEIERNRLSRQHDAMSTYRVVLEERLISAQEVPA